MCDCIGVNRILKVVDEFNDRTVLALLVVIVIELAYIAWKL